MLTACIILITCFSLLSSTKDEINIGKTIMLTILLSYYFGLLYTIIFRSILNNYKKGLKIKNNHSYYYSYRFLLLSIFIVYATSIYLPFDTCHYLLNSAQYYCALIATDKIILTIVISTTITYSFLLRAIYFGPFYSSQYLESNRHYYAIYKLQCIPFNHNSIVNAIILHGSWTIASFSL